MTTNFEKIKAMSIDEMAEWLKETAVFRCGLCALNDIDCKQTECKEQRKVYFKQWLESEEVNE